MPETSAASSSAQKPRGAKNAYPLRTPRFWHGLRFTEWLGLIARHRFRIHPSRWPMAAAITCITPFNSVMGAMQSLCYGSRIAATELREPPIFILGHWRSGTTYLHELMSLDDRFGSPTTYQCFAPRHFLLTECVIARYMGFLMPKQRPMDNMAAGWNRPQEDEFALLTLNAPTPYLRMAFPNEPPPYLELLDMGQVAPGDRARFEQALLYFTRLITFRTGKRLLLKSPPHTGRLETLARLFPGAKFIHITRDPYEIFSSTLRLWESLDDVQGLQRPHHGDLREFVFTAFERMYRGFESQRTKIEANAMLDLRYEDLVRDPLARVQAIYEQLHIDQFEPVAAKIRAHIGEQKDYQPNQHRLEPELRTEIRQRWSGYFERYGYA